jgi:hypothetical protein
MNATLCGYCQSLPVLDRERRGVKSRCPLCRSELLRTGAGVHRCSSESTERRTWGHGKWAWVCVGFAGIAIVLATTLIPWAIAPPSTVARQEAPEVREMLSVASIGSKEDGRNARAVEAPAVREAPSEASIDSKENARNARAVAKVGRASIYVGQVKPASRPPRSQNDHAGTPTPAVAAVPAAEAAPANAANPDFWAAPKMTEGALLAQIEKLPEVGLPDLMLPQQVERGGAQAKNRQKLLDLVKTIEEQNGKKTDGFIANAKETLAELAGLPFAMGDACRLGAVASAHLAEHSQEINTAAATAARASASTSNALRTRNRFVDPYLFWQNYPFRNGRGLTPSTRGAVNVNSLLLDGAPAIEQVLSAEHAGLRLSMAQKMSNVEHPRATKILARRALFDLDANVRRQAVEALQTRPKDDYTALLVEGFRYPWAPVSQHAAEALVALKRTDLVEQLEKIGAEPDPSAPFGEPHAQFVREPVRISHAKNCLLCHPPVGTKPPTGRNAEFPVGRMPIPGEPIAEVYYSSRPDQFFVRADVTYLRQDFSVRLDVATVAPWPTQQRFDILVRTRPLSPAEAALTPPVRSLADSANGAALRFAIERMSGR